MRQNKSYLLEAFAFIASLFYAYQVQALGTPKSDLQITHGLKSRDKTVSVLSASLTQRHLGDAADIVKFVRERLSPMIKSHKDD